MCLGDQHVVGLARVLSKLGYCSRTEAADLIRAARVTINGRVVRNPEHPTDLKRDVVKVDGQRAGRCRASLYSAEQAARAGHDRAR